MNQKLFVGVLVAALALSALAAQQEPPLNNSSSHQHSRPVELAASGDKTFTELMNDAMNAMNQQMENAMSNQMAQVDPDREFVNMMIPHHQGAIDMAKALLLYGKDEQLKRLAQEIIADQQNEVQLMRVWLTKHSTAGSANRKKEIQK